MRKILICLLILAAACMVFGVAMYMDSVPGKHVLEPEYTAERVYPFETTVPVTEAPETEPTETEAPETEPPETEPPEEHFTLTFAGDCTLGCRESHQYMDYGFTKVIGGDYGYPFRNVEEYFENDDFTFLNFEGTLGDSGYPDTSKPHTFRGPTDYVNILTGSSVEAVSLANNHTMDYFQSGYDSTLAALDGAGVPYVERDSSTIVTTESGLTIGIYGAVYYYLDLEDMAAEIAAMKEQGVDVVVYAAHWGTEYTYSPTSTQVEAAHAAIDAGADIVYGSHPHVLQPIEEYNGGVIFYSLGNFSFGGNIYPQDFDTAVLRQEIIRDADGNVSLGQRTIIPASLSSIPDRNDFQPTPYAEGSEEYDRVLRKLDGSWGNP